jgi:hypothetical protein
VILSQATHLSNSAVGLILLSAAAAGGDLAHPRQNACGQCRAFSAALPAAALLERPQHLVERQTANFLPIIPWLYALTFQ